MRAPQKHARRRNLEAGLAHERVGGARGAGTELKRAMAGGAVVDADAPAVAGSGEAATGRRGRQLNVLVRWGGEQPVTREPWPDLWVPITALTADQVAIARGLEEQK